MYDSLLFIHSWTRWILFLSTIYFVFHSLVSWLRGKSWSGPENHFLWVYSQVFAYQFLFGLFLLIGFSPFVKAAIRDPSLIASDALVFFWTVRHPLTMTSAIGVFHITRSVARRRPKKQFMIYALGLLVVLALLISAIPWPSSIAARPWIRGF